MHFFFPVPLIPFPGANKMATKVLKICTLNYADSFPYKAWFVVNKASVLNERSWHASFSINKIQYIAFKKMTRAALIIQSQYRTYREHERFKKSRRAAAIIQNSFRSYRERRRSSQRRREQRLSKRQEARYIQLASNRLVKYFFIIIHLCAVLVQSALHFFLSKCGLFIGDKSFTIIRTISFMTESEGPWVYCEGSCENPVATRIFSTFARALATMATNFWWEV